MQTHKSTYQPRFRTHITILLLSGTVALLQLDESEGRSEGDVSVKDLGETCRVRLSIDYAEELAGLIEHAIDVEHDFDADEIARLEGALRLIKSGLRMARRSGK